MLKVKSNGYTRITKARARALVNSGAEVFITNHKLMPGNSYSWMAIHQFIEPEMNRGFDYCVQTWQQFNANNEWGYYPSFYVKA